MHIHLVSPLIFRQPIVATSPVFVGLCPCPYTHVLHNLYLKEDSIVQLLQIFMSFIPNDMNESVHIFLYFGMIWSFLF